MTKKLRLIRTLIKKTLMMRKRAIRIRNTKRTRNADFSDVQSAETIYLSANISDVSGLSAFLTCP